MNRIIAKQLKEHVGQTVRIRGWINTIRSLGKLHFLILRDRSGFIQVVLDDKVQIQKISHLQVALFSL